VSFTFSKPTSAAKVVLMQSTDGGDTWKTANIGSLNAQSDSATVTGLTNDVEYCFQLVVTGGTRAGDSNKVYATPSAP